MKENRNLKDLVNYSVDPPQPTFLVSYLEATVIPSDEEFDTPELKMELKNKPVFLQTQQVRAQFTNDQRQALESFGIDADKEIKTALKTQYDFVSEKRILDAIKTNSIEDRFTPTSKFTKLLYKLFKYKPNYTVNDLVSNIIKNSHDILVKTRRSYGNFVLVPSELSSYIYEDERFIIHAVDNEFFNLTGSIRNIGSVNNVEVFIYDELESNEILVGYCGTKSDLHQTIHFYELNDKEVKEIESENNYVMRGRYAIVDFPNTSLNYRRIKFDFEKHSLIKHITTKIKGLFK